MLEVEADLCWGRQEVEEECPAQEVVLTRDRGVGGNLAEGEAGTESVGTC